MKPGTSIIYGPTIPKHGKIEDTIIKNGNTAYLVCDNETGRLYIVQPEDIEVIEHEHTQNSK